MINESNLSTNFEELSNDIIISIIEYLSLEDFILIFGKLNTRFAGIIFDHRWTHYQLNIREIDDDNLKKKFDFIENMKLTSKITSIYIRPYSIYRSIETFNQYNLLSNFINLKSLSLNNITLEEMETIFSSENLSKLIHLNRLNIIFSLVMEQNNYCLRVEQLISQIFSHPSLRYCTIHVPRSINFSQIQSSSSIEYFNINHCSLQSLYTLFEYTPYLRHLTATIPIIDEIKNEKLSIPPLLNSLTINLSTTGLDDLINLIKKIPKLQKLDIVTYSIIEPLNYTTSWFKLITDYLPALTKFKRESYVALENIAEYMEAYHWPNGWKLHEKIVQKEDKSQEKTVSSYSRIKIINTRY